MSMLSGRGASRRSLLTALGAAAIGVSFSACSRPGAAPAGGGEEPKLNFYNWDTYIGETTLADFKASSGVDVNMSLFATNDELFAKQLVCLRLAVILCHARQTPEYEAVRLAFKSGTFKVTTTPGWAKRYPQSAWLLSEEALAWQKTDWKFSADIR